MNEPALPDLPIRFERFIRDKRLIGTHERVLLAVSGGMDSMVMAWLFRKADIPFAIAHCNFSMRGDESDGDEEAVRTMAAGMQAIFHSRKFDTSAFARQNKLSIQDAARKLRYEWFEKLSVEHGYDKIATAHHHNDSIETFFINLFRGSGPAGLRGIPVKNRNIIRPLLFATRSEIADYAKSEKIMYRTDSSNETDDYLRNRIRHHLIPMLGTLSEDYERRFADVFENISFLHDYSMKALEDWREKNMVKTQSGEIVIPADKIKSQSDPLQFMSLLLYSIGINGINCEQVLSEHQPGKIFNRKDYSLLCDRDSYILKRHTEQPGKLVISEIPSTVIAGVRKMKIGYTTGDQLTTENANRHQLDGEKVKLPLTIRTWEEGDYFYPLGMKGRKKISDFFIDNKLNLFEKQNTFLLLSGNDIVCILGHRIDERYKVTDNTNKILTIEFT